MVRLPVALSVLALALWASTPSCARAQQAIYRTSDAIYVGFRGEPGAAFLLAYDLDILVTDPASGVSLRPSASFSFGGQSSADLGRRQEWLLSADYLRVRVTLFQNYGFRAMALLGAGMWFAALHEQVGDPRAVLLEDGTPAIAREVHPWALLYGAVLTGGVAADWYFTDYLGITAFLVGHARLDDQSRMPGLWIEAGLGGRWGQ